MVISVNRQRVYCAHLLELFSSQISSSYADKLLQYSFVFLELLLRLKASSSVLLIEVSEICLLVSV